MKKSIFYISLVLLSVLITLTLYTVFYSLYALIAGTEEATGILTKSTMYLFFLRFTGTVAFICIGIATALGAMRNILFSFLNGDASLSRKKTAFWKVHTQWATSIGIGMISAHLTIYLLYQYRLGIPLTLKLFYPNFIRFTSTNNLIFISTAAFIIFTLNFLVTNIPGVTGKKWWKPLHIFNYLGFFLVLLHAYYLGSDSSELVFLILYGTFLVLALTGAIHRFFKFIGKLRVKKEIPTPVSTQPISNTTHSVQQNVTTQIPTSPDNQIRK